MMLTITGNPGRLHFLVLSRNMSLVKKYVLETTSLVNGTILHLIKKKNTVRRKLRSSKSSYLTEKFKYLRATIKRESRRHFYTSLGGNLRENPKRLWSVMKNQSKASSIPSTISTKVNTKHQNNRIKAKTPQSISSMFNNYFTSIFI